MRQHRLDRQARLDDLERVHSMGQPRYVVIAQGWRGFGECPLSLATPNDSLALQLRQRIAHGAPARAQDRGELSFRGQSPVFILLLPQSLSKLVQDPLFGGFLRHFRSVFGVAAPIRVWDHIRDWFGSHARLSGARSRLARRFRLRQTRQLCANSPESMSDTWPKFCADEPICNHLPIGSEYGGVLQRRSETRGDRRQPTPARTPALGRCRTRRRSLGTKALESVGP